MKTRSRCLLGVVVVAALVVWAVGARAETWQLEMKTLKDARDDHGAVPVTQLVEWTASQSFFAQLGGSADRRVREEGKPEFDKVITKEPAEYAAKYPFRGVVKLGDSHYGFVMDVAKPKEDVKDKKDEAKKDAEKTEAKDAEDSKKEAAVPKKDPMAVAPFTRLYFDLNHNGDLTDDGVIESSQARNLASSYARSAFPPTAVTIESGGKKIDFAFSMDVYTYTAGRDASGMYSFAHGQLKAATYRQGEVSLGDKKYRAFLVDYNGNGRFNDASMVDPNVGSGDDTVYASDGDRLYLVAPDANLAGFSPYDPTTFDGTHLVGQRTALDGRFFDMSVSPSGDTLSLVPSEAPVGYVTNPNKGYRALDYNKDGVLKVIGDADGKAPLPEGQWRLLSYTIDQTGYAKPADEKADSQGPSLLEALGSALLGGPSGPQQIRRTFVSAQARRSAKAVTVAKDATVELPFGPPYRPMVSVQYRSGKDQVQLGLSIVGRADEVCTDLTVDGTNPPKPELTISTEDGKEVVTGNFEYG